MTILSKFISLDGAQEVFQREATKFGGQGLRVIYGEAGLARKVPIRLRPIAYFLSYFFAPLTYMLPCLGVYMVCEGKQEQKSCILLFLS